jgi:hypothetical protein
MRDDQTVSDSVEGQAAFAIGARVRIAESAVLEGLIEDGITLHWPRLEQVACGGQVAIVAEVGVMKRLGPVYRLSGVPGLWPEACLESADLPVELYVWHSDLPLMNSEAVGIHGQIANGLQSGLQRHSSVEDFRREFDALVHEDHTEADAIGLTPMWEPAPEFRAEYVRIFIAAEWYIEGAEEVLALADRHSLVCFNVQERKAILPMNLGLEKVYRFVAEQCHRRREELGFETRLQADLGLRSTKARKFFVDFEEEFGTNLGTLLGGYWQLYFAKPRISPLFAALFILWMCFGLFYATGWIPIWLRIGLLVIPAVPAWRFFQSEDLSKPIQITIQDLIVAAQSGSWQKVVD